MTGINVNSKAALDYATKQINELAREDGIFYGFWPEIRPIMEVAELTDPDIQYVLKFGVVTAITIVSMVGQCKVIGLDTDERKLAVTVIVHEAIPMIVIANLVIMES